MSKPRPDLKFIRLQKNENQKTSDRDKCINIPWHVAHSQTSAVLDRAPNFASSSKGLKMVGGISLLIIKPTRCTNSSILFLE